MPARANMRAKLPFRNSAGSSEIVKKEKNIFTGFLVYYIGGGILSQFQQEKAPYIF